MVTLTTGLEGKEIKEVTAEVRILRKDFWDSNSSSIIISGFGGGVVVIPGIWFFKLGIDIPEDWGFSKIWELLSRGLVIFIPGDWEFLENKNPKRSYDRLRRRCRYDANGRR